MSLTHLSELSQKNQQALKLCDEKIAHWTKFKLDYKALDERLTELIDRTTHQIMMPVTGSNVAFMPATIRHTNEILVYLGEGYFVERSTKQAKEIIKRKIQKCDKMIDSLNLEKKQIENWLNITHQLKGEGDSDFVEIIEEYNEEKERQWKEEHKKRVKEHRERSKLNDESLIHECKQRLDELESEEYESEHLSGVEKDTNLKSILKNSKSDLRKSVSFDENEASVIITDPQVYPLPNVQMESINPIEETAEENEEEDSCAAFRNEIIERSVSFDKLIDEEKQVGPSVSFKDEIIERSVNFEKPVDEEDSCVPFKNEIIERSVSFDKPIDEEKKVGPNVSRFKASRKK